MLIDTFNAVLQVANTYALIDNSCKLLMFLLFLTSEDIEEEKSIISNDYLKMLRKNLCRNQGFSSIINLRCRKNLEHLVYTQTTTSEKIILPTLFSPIAEENIWFVVIAQKKSSVIERAGFQFVSCFIDFEGKFNNRFHTTVLPESSNLIETLRNMDYLTTIEIMIYNGFYLNIKVPWRIEFHPFVRLSLTWFGVRYILIWTHNMKSFLSTNRLKKILSFDFMILPLNRILRTIFPDSSLIILTCTYMYLNIYDIY